MISVYSSCAAFDIAILILREVISYVAPIQTRRFKIRVT